MLAAAVVILCSAIPGGAYAQTQAQRATVDQAKVHLNQGRPADAYALLAPLEDQLAGDADYDYLLGVSALDSGKADKATLAFERVLASNPNFAGARLDMARAYYQLGDLPCAKSEFATVLEQNPPDEARQVVLRYLGLIETAEKAQLRSLRAYVEGTIGFDTNINNSTSQATINVPFGGVFIPFTLAATNVATRANFWAVGTGAEYSEKVSSDVALFVGADWRNRDNSKGGAFDAENYEYRGGATLGQGPYQLRLAGNYGRYYLDSALNRHTDGVGGDFRYSLDPSNQLNAFSQYTRVRFTGATQINSFDSLTSGIGGLHLMNEGRAAVLGAFFFGRENDTDGRVDGKKGFSGFRLGGQLKIRDDLDGFVQGSMQSGWYVKENVIFLQKRHDELRDLSVGLNWRFTKDWTLRPQLAYQRNKSNIAIYQFERTELSLTLRKDFNF